MTMYTLGIKLGSKDDYDRLMNNHSVEQTGIFLRGIDYKNSFQGYPNDYPCLVEYEVDQNPIGFMMSAHVSELVNDGFLIQIKKEP